MRWHPRFFAGIAISLCNQTHPSAVVIVINVAVFFFLSEKESFVVSVLIGDNISRGRKRWSIEVHIEKLLGTPLMFCHSTLLIIHRGWSTDGVHLRLNRCESRLIIYGLFGFKQVCRLWDNIKLLVTLTFTSMIFTIITRLSENRCRSKLVSK